MSLRRGHQPGGRGPGPERTNHGVRLRGTSLQSPSAGDKILLDTANPAKVIIESVAAGEAVVTGAVGWNEAFEPDVAPDKGCQTFAQRPLMQY